MPKQVRGEEATRKYRAGALSATRFWGGWDFWRARKSFLKPVIKVVKSGYWADSAKNILGFKEKKTKPKTTHRKMGKVLSQFPAQLLLNTHLYNENTQAGGLYSLHLGRNRTGLQGQSVALALLVSAFFILRHHRRADG